MKKLFSLLSVVLIQFSLMAQPCSELFFSEYIEGSSFNKAIEIYNPTSAPVDLSDYSLWLFSNGGTTKNSASMDTLPNVMLAPGATYVFAHTSSDTAIVNVADSLNNVVNFNGDDAFVLFNRATNDTVDKIGEVGFRPSGGWDVDGGNGNTKDFTLVRKASVQEGTHNWAVAQNQWEAYPANTFTYLGSHTMTPCGPVVDTLVSFFTPSITVQENQSPVSIGINLNAIDTSSNFTVDVVLESGDTANISGYMGETVNFSSMSEQISINLSFDTITGPESFVFKLRNPTGNLLLSADSVFTLTVTPVVQIPVYKIATVRGNNTNGAPDSLGVLCQLYGTVIGPNYLASGLQFTLNDGTAGISVRIPGQDFGYTVNEGDSVKVVGQVGQYRGLGQMEYLDTVKSVGTGRSITPTDVTTLDESTEGELVRMENVEILGLNYTSAAGSTYDARLGGFDFTIFLDVDVISANDDPIDGHNELSTLVGIGGQYGPNSAPYTSGYQITPRKLEDVEVATGISNDLLSTGITNIYPNPAQNSLFIKLENDINAEQVMVFDITGKNVSNSIVSNINSGNIKLDISALQNGSYVVQVRTKENNIQAKFMIAK